MARNGHSAAHGTIRITGSASEYTRRAMRCRLAHVRGCMLWPFEEGRMSRIAIVCALAVLTLSANAADDEICTRLHAFETAPRPLGETGSTRDWIEMRWVGAWMDFDNGWHLECRHSSSNSAAELCGWLIENTSFEFSNYLPIRLLECHDFKFPRPYPNADTWIEKLALFPETGDEHMVLEIALGGHKGDDAIRYSVFVGPAAEQKNRLPPLFPPLDFIGPSD